MERLREIKITVEIVTTQQTQKETFASDGEETLDELIERIREWARGKFPEIWD